MIFEKRELKKKSENISDWYNDVLLKAEIADYGPAKGTMVIRPYGYAIWERVQSILDGMFKAYGVQNAYFPLLFPYSLLEKEKAHVAGFSPELAVVTHGGGEDLAEPLVVRPTSETIMYVMYAKWIQSWRDLPVLINQWNNVVRWEKRTYLFLRTLEFLWQEGHTAHATYEEAEAMAKQALDWYKTMYENYYAIPVIVGTKSETEKFAGAQKTYTVEALMPDGKALQACTSHNLGQNFSKAFDIQFQTQEGTRACVYQTSWGFSTRSMGGLFLVHGDDNGLVLPPHISPIQTVIIPIFKKGDDIDYIAAYCQDIQETLQNGGVRAKFDNREEPSVGRRFNEWEVKGVPLRFEIGKREVDNAVITIARRDTGEKFTIKRSDMLVQTQKLLEQIQHNLYEKAKKFLDGNTSIAKDYKTFKAIMEERRGFIQAFWCESKECEAKIKEETKATTRCLPLDAKEEQGSCIYCGKNASHQWIFAQSY
ncbi:MAG: proline--tRNA ligase [Patescibacteria group bacterium]|nr:proline--tRNA ligase [Patescibacteria group bacterium]